MSVDVDALRREAALLHELALEDANEMKKLRLERDQIAYNHTLLERKIVELEAHNRCLRDDNARLTSTQFAAEIEKRVRDELRLEMEELRKENKLYAVQSEADATTIRKLEHALDEITVERDQVRRAAKESMEAASQHASELQMLQDHAAQLRQSNVQLAEKCNELEQELEKLRTEDWAAWFVRSGARDNKNHQQGGASAVALPYTLPTKDVTASPSRTQNIAGPTQQYHGPMSPSAGHDPRHGQQQQPIGAAGLSKTVNDLSAQAAALRQPPSTTVVLPTVSSSGLALTHGPGAAAVGVHSSGAAKASNHIASTGNGGAENGSGGPAVYRTLREMRLARSGGASLSSSMEVDSSSSPSAPHGVVEDIDDSGAAAGRHRRNKAAPVGAAVASSSTSHPAASSGGATHTRGRWKEDQHPLDDDDDVVNIGGGESSPQRPSTTPLEIEAIYGEQGAGDQRLYLVKYRGVYSECWALASTVDADCAPVRQWKEAKRRDRMAEIAAGFSQQQQQPVAGHRR